MTNNWFILCRGSWFILDARMWCWWYEQNIEREVCRTLWGSNSWKRMWFKCSFFISNATLFLSIFYLRWNQLSQLKVYFTWGEIKYHNCKSGLYCFEECPLFHFFLLHCLKREDLNALLSSRTHFLSHNLVTCWHLIITLYTLA